MPMLAFVRRHQVVAVADRLVRKHAAVGAVVVRLHHADKAPLTAQYVVKQVRVREARDGADEVEGRSRPYVKDLAKQFCNETLLLLPPFLNFIIIRQPSEYYR